MSQPPAKMTTADQPLVGMTTTGQLLEKMTATVKSMDLMLVWSMLKNQKNCLSQKNQKAKKRLSLEIWLSQEKSHQKVGIQLILTLQKSDQSS